MHKTNPMLQNQSKDEINFLNLPYAVRVYYLWVQIKLLHDRENGSHL